jgi:dihydropyrimidine dehydrogenase (NAD+) subunit PreT
LSEYLPPSSESDFENNFSQIKPLMNDTEAYYESSRCLFCFDAPCVNACPSDIDIPLFIRQINTKNTIGAAKTIYDANYFGYACGKVCPTEVLCEGACVYNIQNVKPIEIGRLQSYATSQAINTNRMFYHPAPPNGKKVAIIGAGPAGISCACELRMYGFYVDVFEAKARPSGLTVHGVAPYKITNEEALKEMDYLAKQFGFTVHYNETVTTEKLKDLEENYNAIFIGIGLGPTSELKIPGEELQNVFGAVEFVENLRMKHHDLKIPARIIVLGGGNTAMDAASESARMGAEKVILAYRRNKEQMGAYDFEYDLAKSVAVKGLFNVAPLEILGNGHVTGVKFIRTAEEKGLLKNIPGSEFFEECDAVIKATGQSKQSGLLSQINNLTTDEKGRVKINIENFQTENPKYFAAGDVISGGQEVVNAAAEGRKAAHGIRKFLFA